MTDTLHVYALIDPRDGLPFYIGQTSSLRDRLLKHGNDRASAAWSRISELRELRMSAEIISLAAVEGREAAKREEAWLILRTPGLVNRNVPFVAPEKTAPPEEPDELTRLRALDARDRAKKAKAAAYMRGYRARTKLPKK